MKKTLLLALILLIVCMFSFSACDNGDTPSNNDSGNNQQTTEGNGNNNSGSENNNSDTPTVCQHTFGSWSTVKQATCKEEGKLVRTCSKCSGTEESTVSKSDTHTEVVDAAVSATCTMDGKTEGKHCSVCGKTIVAQTTVKASGHSEVVDPAVNATCETEGKTEGKHCSVCGTVTVKQNSINKISHNYKNGACTMCKNIDTAAKQVEIRAENERHEAKLAQIEEYYPSIISGLQENINNLKDTYGITYVYSDSYCYDKISSLTSEISTLQRKIASLSGSTNSADIAEKRQYESQLSAKEAEQNKYYKCITINSLNNEITNYQAYYAEAIDEENDLHTENIAIIESKYKCYEDKHNVVIISQTAPTCEENGLAEGVYCETCKKYIVAQNEIISDGHDINESTGVCKICNANIAEIGFIFEWNDIWDAYALVEYVGNNSDVVVPSKYKGKDVAIIGRDAFKNCSHVTSVYIPVSVHTIYGGAFSGCSSLESLTLSWQKDDSYSKYLDGITHSGDLLGYIFGQTNYAGAAVTQAYASWREATFYIPASLKTITVNGGYIPYGAFYNCTNITNIYIDDSVINVGDNAFYNCTNLNFNEFNGCYYLGNENNPYLVLVKTKSQDIASCEISKQTKVICSFAFDSCSSLTDISFENGSQLEHIRNYVFYNCSALKNIEIPKSMRTIGNGVFYGCDNINYNLYDNAYYLGDSSNPYIILIKGKNDTITTCEIHQNTIIIYQSAFYNYSKLKVIEIPDKVITVHQYAFYGCQAAEQLVLGENIKEIVYGAFSNCTNLKTIKLNCSIVDYNYIVPNSSSHYEAFANAGHNSSELTLVVGSKVTSISKYLFNTGSSPDAPYITCILFEEGSVCEIIDYTAFGYCRKLKKVVLPNSIGVIGERAFESYASFDVYYIGTTAEWNEININQDVSNKCFKNVYFYSETMPTISGMYWHYVNDVPTVWN